MEPIYGRPPLGEIFSPLRQSLNEENNYLGKVGLVIFIRGFPSPNMARTVAQTLLAVHGGRQADYEVAEATIAPYLVTCRSSQLRDAVVRRGIYTNPQAQVQFVVHEWRPRFGMGYDPPTHQVWVKLVGLPLQAWTTPEITAFLQKFGHPLQIEPFGKAIGNYNDITALVATNEPSRIPLAYTYKEGDYATQVDIYIISWRLWDDSNFPPPDDPTPRHNRGTQQQCHGNPPNPVNLHRSSSSSSSSNGMPSEPTIDLSAWSPRSRQITRPSPEMLCLTQKPEIKNGSTINTCILQMTQLKPHSPVVLSDPSQSAVHRANRSLTTENPNPPTELAQISRFLYAYLLPTLNPIVINCFFALQTVDCHSISLRVARKEGKTIYSLKKSFGNDGSQEGVLEGAAGVSMRNALYLVSQNLSTSVRMGQSESQRWAEEINPNSTTQAHISNLQPTPSFLTQQEPSLFGNLSGSPIQQAEDEGQEDTLRCATKDLSQGTRNAQDVTIEDHPVEKRTQNETALSDAHLPSNQTQRKKGAKMATRRSQRIQDKRHVTPAVNSPVKNRSHKCKIPFSSDSLLSPLDASKTLEILQASGLQINKQIEDMIDEAVKRDQASETPEQPMPQTPLHDHIPPLTVPGTDLFL